MCMCLRERKRRRRESAFFFLEKVKLTKSGLKSLLDEAEGGVGGGGGELDDAGVVYIR